MTWLKDSNTHCGGNRQDDSKSAQESLVMCLDSFMGKQPEGRWHLDGDYWKSYHSHENDSEEFECYSWIDRRIESDGRVHTGYSELEDGYDEGGCESITYESLEDMLESEF